MADEIPTLPIYTVGHSNRTFDDFVALLASAGVRQVVDVRRFPRSRTNPQYNLEALSETLPAHQVRYTIVPELGGRRSGRTEVPPEVNGHWRHPSFHAYADYALSEGFSAGLDRLRVLARETPSAIMCSEAVWWRCHRRIIADYLLLEGRDVLHLMGNGRIEKAVMTPGAVAAGSWLTYPAVAP
jgi:uncharacterized protein (DUF488 family)